MKRWLATAALCLSLCLCLQAGAQTAPADCPPSARAPTADERAQIVAQARDHGFLWRVSKRGKSSYLYGTIHVGRMEWMFPGPQTLAALKGSQVLAVELDFTDTELMQRLQNGMAPRADPAGPPLPDDLAERLRKALHTACVPPELLQSMAPEMLGTLLVMMSARRDGLDASYGIDPTLAQLARQLLKPVVSLETPEMQLALLRSTTPDDLREGLEKMLDDLDHDRSRPLLLRVARLWEQGRADEMARYREWCGCAGTARERAALKAMLDDRNPAMAERIDALHAGGKTVFAAVGSLHMFGPTGLPALMAKRGYKVERVSFKN
ncbi:TraB/GumN family protein [Sphaerotilaceae bacterium SBD11-9]